VVFLRDEGSIYDATLDEIWTFVSSGDHHSSAHGHAHAERTPISSAVGEYAWEQPWEGAPTRFKMRWTSFHPLGVAYQVLEGPFAGSHFFLYYEPLGPRTGVAVVGEFVAPTIEPDRIDAAVRRFFALEFDQDAAAIARDRATSRT
jgi:hypothetical protein